ncbi:MAG: polysaccharide biosynthesis protein [Tagaea sp.]|nr:polysaccharide biosynthesis protein [Tagaea sp.]
MTVPAPFLARFDRVTLSMAIDTSMAAVAFVLALWLRLGDDIWDYPDDFIWGGALVFAATAAIAFWITGLPRGVWRYAGADDLIQAARAVTLALLLFLPAMFLWQRLEVMPRSALFIAWTLLFALLAGPRLLYRAVREGHLDLTAAGPRPEQVQVLVVGANDGAELFIQANRRRRRAPFFVLGLIDDSGNRTGRRIGGVDILGPVDALAGIVERLKGKGLLPQRLVVAARGIEGESLQALVDAADRLGMTCVRLPRINDLSGEAADATATAPIAIEDLLGRPQRVLDRDAMDALIRGRRVLVTGAGGSIGAELVRQIAQRGPSRLALIENSEHALYTIDREIAENWSAVERVAVLADIREPARLGRVFAAEKPDIVFHAAALKHLPILEDNPVEGALTNSVGTRNVADAAIAAGARAVVMISTDKAVNPTNVLGATKRLAEKLCQALDAAQSPTQFVTVRFGNVLGSSGSVVPLFQRQLAQGGPLTVTHPEVRRYFMTIREACELVLQASVLATSAKGPSVGAIMVLEMGAPVRIQDLARRMIRLAGKRPDIDVKIVYTGLKPGEKLDEELFHGAEAPRATANPDIKIARPELDDLAQLRAALARLEDLARAGDDKATLTLLRELVPEYKPA